MRRSRRWASLLVAGSMAFTTVSCGVQGEERPETLSASEVPYGLLEEAPSTTTSTTLVDARKVGLVIFLVVGGRLHPAPRSVTTPLTVAKALSALLAGPEEDEAVAGLRSAINPAASLVPSRVDPSTWVVDVSTEFVQGPTSEQVLGLAQIVFTLTEIPGVTGVRFTLEGAPIEVPTPSGTTSAPLGRDAFVDLAPAPPEPGAAS
ncbi:MAG: GerMN domain-containing protein [Actinobacteria bacterium]|nr:GerMN domain-containing protein [Actinomycetota bacterium]MBW3649397.1 GerMN domain-containing protein [Actinomycetota bacterium]